MNVIVISRSAEKLEEVKRGILKEHPGVEVRCMAYDYTDRCVDLFLVLGEWVVGMGWGGAF